MAAIVRAVGILAAAVSNDLAARLSPIASGEVVVIRDWISPSLAAALRNDARAIRARGLFRASGLRDNAPGASQVYDERDRLVCNLAPNLPGDRRARRALDAQLDELRGQLEGALGRRGLRCAEQYFSVHGSGSSLRRHLDERHEDTKGERGWVGATRRSVSWLVYLCAPGSGGELRAWQRPTSGRRCGAHDGNLQLGWLKHGAGPTDRQTFEPLYLDSWVRALDGREARSVIYRLAGDRREDLSGPFSAGSGSWPAPADGSGFSPEELEAAFRAQLPLSLRSLFQMTDTVDASSARVEVEPLGGTLVLFDSVAVPHEVAPILAGERIAIAGWFHEKQQEQPDWFGV